VAKMDESSAARPVATINERRMGPRGPRKPRVVSFKKHLPLGGEWNT
jgi:hypothetical protein